MAMKYPSSLSNLLFVDIETVSSTATYEDLSPAMQKHWDRKASILSRGEEIAPEQMYVDKAAIYAEFGKIITIGLGYLHFRESGSLPELRLTVLASDDERELLQTFADMLQKMKHPGLTLCGHNAKEFDFPYLSRRMLVCGIPLPDVLDTGGKKPWEVMHIDTMELWKFGDYKSYTPLDLLASLFEVPTSKEGIDGSQVGAAYYQEQALDKIAKYCLEDVRVTAQVYLRLKGLPALGEEQIVRSLPDHPQQVGQEETAVKVQTIA